MSVPIVRFLAVVTVEAGPDRADDSFRSFQEAAEGMLIYGVERASLADLEEFAPDVVALKPGRIDSYVAPLVDVADDPDEDDDEEGDDGKCEYTGLHRIVCPCEDCNPPDS
jgi:hypothetical protein